MSARTKVLGMKVVGRLAVAACTWVDRRLAVVVAVVVCTLEVAQL